MIAPISTRRTITHVTDRETHHGQLDPSLPLTETRRSAPKIHIVSTILHVAISTFIIIIIIIIINYYLLQNLY